MRKFKDIASMLEQHKEGQGGARVLAQSTKTNP